jgi:hypothetical protein
MASPAQVAMIRAIFISGSTKASPSTSRVPTLRSILALVRGPTLEFGHTQSAGPITCDSEPTGMTCTDTSSGHFFRVSRESDELG